MGDIVDTLFSRAKTAVILSVSVCCIVFTHHSASAATDVTLAWDPSTSPDVVGYNIYYGTNSGSYPNKVILGNVTTITITGLISGKTYYFAATAYNSMGLESTPSNELPYTVPTTSVIASNQPPTLNLMSNLAVNEDSSQQTVNLSGISSGVPNENQNLTVTATSSNPSLISNPTVSYTSPNTTGTLTFAPAANANGSATITVTVNDNQSQNNLISRSFTVTVNAVNDAPTLNSILGMTINENASQQTVNLSGISSGAANENQNLTVTATSSNPGLVPNPSVTYTSPNSTGTLSFTPVANASGSATITVTVNDNQSQNNLTSRNFTVTVNPSPQSHTFTTISNPTVPGSGTYNGLFYEETGVQQNSSGSFTLTVSTKGSYSCKVQIGKSNYRFSGKIDSDGPITNTVSSKDGSSMTIVLWTDGSNPTSDQIYGELTDGAWTSTLSGDKVVFDSKTNPSPYAGNYTLIIPQDKNQPLPMGYGYATLKADARGSIKITGMLADGTKISQSTTVSGNGSLPLYVPLYRGNGSTISWITFTNNPNYDLTGILSWINPSDPRAKYYPGGFTNECCTLGSAYSSFASTSNYTNVLVSGVNYYDSNPDSKQLKIKIKSKDGTFKFSAKDSATNKKLSFIGAVFQKMNAGYGMCLDADQTSKPVVLSP